MNTYEKAGVNVEKGDAASSLAYAAAKATFAGREGKMGSAAILEGGFSGALDMGNFYLVQNDDGVGSKSMIAESLGKYDTLGQDLLAMVADDAICVGAEVISMTNTVDIEHVDTEVIGAMMEGLKKVCLEQKIVVPGGEIAELPGQVKGMVWNATAVGVVEKDKFIDGSKVAGGDIILGLRSAGFRSNGFTLVRHILSKEFGDDWVNADYGDGRTWGDVVLEPSIIYHRGLLKILGAYGEARKVDVHGIVHVTGGGLEANTQRVVIGELKAEFTDLWEPHEAMLRLMEMGNVSEDDAEETWNMGTGMLVIVAPEDVDAAIEGLGEFEVKAIGKVI